MTKLRVAFAFSLAGVWMVACGGNGLKTMPPIDGGNAGGVGFGGVHGSGGSATGAGGQENTGGTTATGGGPSTGGHAGSNTGGSASGGVSGSGSGGRGFGGTSGAGGTACLPVMCPMIACQYGSRPNPDPCGCPLCNPSDAGADAAPDAECLRTPCPLLKCGPGYELSAPTCGCPTCVPVDGGAPDSATCPPTACPAIACVHGTVPNPDPCGCPICAAPDAGARDTTICSVLCPAIACPNGTMPSPEPCGCPTCAPGADGGPDSRRLACVGLDECACYATTGCAPIADGCYCPYPKCDVSGACTCGGGAFIGCASSGLATCDAVKARVGSICPQLNGSIWDGLCNRSYGACITECLNEVTSCGDISCSMCEA